MIIALSIIVLAFVAFTIHLAKEVKELKSDLINAEFKIRIMDEKFSDNIHALKNPFEYKNGDEIYFKDSTCYTVNHKKEGVIVESFRKAYNPYSGLYNQYKVYHNKKLIVVLEKDIIGLSSSNSK